MVFDSMQKWSKLTNSYLSKLKKSKRKDLKLKLEVKNKSALTIFGSFFLVIIIDFDVSFILAWSLFFIEFGLDELSDFLENCINVNIVFCTGLYEFHSKFFCKFLSFLKGNLAIFVSTIWLVADNDFTDAFRLTLADFLQPVFYVFEGFSVRDWVN